MITSIQETVQKIKYYRNITLNALESRDIFLSLLFILVAGISFGLGRLSGEIADRPAVEITQSASVFEAINNSADSASKEHTGSTPALQDTPQGKFVGSVNSDKYHYPWCPGAQRIHNENKVWFASKKEARMQGYTPAGNCKGLVP